MADITNPQAIQFSNHRLRPASEIIGQAMRTLEELDAQWTSQNLAPLFAGSQALLDSTVADGSTTDGRPTLLGYDVNLAMSQVQAMLAWWNHADQNALRAAILKPALNTRPIF